jgi:5-methyltetrahydrofolate--homocysteine methyltransferase
MGMVDLGGNLDILASFRGTENLLMDLYDEPEEVQRCIWEIEALWLRYYDELNAILEECNQGYADWSMIYSSKRVYVPQSDFCFMIGNSLFKEFVAPQLSLFAKRIPNTMYHLDGPGELTHLEDIVNMDFNAIQWVKHPETKITDWPDVYKRIGESGKGIQIWNEPGGASSMEERLETLARQSGNRNALLHNPVVDDLSKRDEYIALLKKYGIEV